jgi:hypothetical protein
MGLFGFMWPPRVVVVEVAVLGEGIERKEVIPEKREVVAGEKTETSDKWDGRPPAQPPPREFVTPEKVIRHPRKAYRVVAHLGHLVGDSTNMRPEIGGNIAGQVRTDWTHVFAEWGLILAAAAFLLAVIPRSQEPPVLARAFEALRPNNGGEPGQGEAVLAEPPAEPPIAPDGGRYRTPLGQG